MAVFAFRRPQMKRFIGEQYRIGSTTEPPVGHRVYDDLPRFDFARHYTEFHDVWTEEPAMREVVHGLLDALPDIADAHVLDVGSGRAVDTRFLLARGARVTSIDLVSFPEWAEITAQYGDKVRFLCAGLLDLEPVAEYDAVLDTGCIHHQQPDVYEKYLRRIRDLLRPAGVLTLSVFHSTEHQGRRYVNEADRLYREFTRVELTDLVQRAGFVPMELRHARSALADSTYLVMTARKAS
jgi:cyclopropane fatty-acyl-phospholipid synthase-like methyltransferase